MTAWLGIANLASLNTRLDSVLQGPAQRMVRSLRLSEELVEVVRAERDLMLSANREQADGFEAELMRLRQDFVTRAGALETTAAIEFKPLWAELRTSWQQYTSLQDKIVDDVRHDARPQALELSTGAEKQALTGARAALRQAVDVNQKRFDDARADAEQEYQTARLILIAVVLISTLIAAATGAWIAVGVATA